MKKKFFISLLILLTFVSPMAVAEYENYAAMAINGEDGEVLYAQNPDKIVFPASLTKLMTLYITFQSIKEGRVSMYDMITVSNNAASQLPKKIYLTPGRRYFLRDLIFASAIFSANDATVAIAEEIGGSSDDFTYLMNKTAEKIGMTSTNFVAPAGFYNPKHKTTARDMLKLISRLNSDFPEYYSIFSMTSFVMDGKIYGNLNKLLLYFKGLDGLKTGFTNASGYNLATSFRYKDRKIFAVVFGFPSADSRDRHMREVMTYSVKKILHKKVEKDEASGRVMFEYDKYIMSGEEIEKEAAPNIYFDIASNMIDNIKNSGNKNKDDQIISTLSILLNASESISHPIPNFRN